MVILRVLSFFSYNTEFLSFFNTEFFEFFLTQSFLREDTETTEINLPSLRGSFLETPHEAIYPKQSTRSNLAGGGFFFKQLVISN